VVARPTTARRRFSLQSPEAEPVTRDANEPHAPERPLAPILGDRARPCGYAAGTPVWESILEWCADLFGVSVHSKLGQLVITCLVLFGLGLVLSQRWGLLGWVLPAVMVGLASLAARQVTSARNEAWRAACLGLDDRRQRPHEAPSLLLAPTAASLLRLAAAVNAVRRGRYTAAEELVPLVHRNLLRPEEVNLLDAVGAMISMGTGSPRRAAQQAAVALPTGSEALDACLGRTLVADAWHDPGRLSAIQSAWEQAGVNAGSLSRLRTLVRIRLDADQLDAVATPEARELSAEARAIGDDELAAELDARGRAAYR
jgi:hypothetical protein